MRLALVICPYCLRGKEEASAIYAIPIHTNEVATLDFQRMCNEHGEVTLHVIGTLHVEDDL